MTLAGIVASLRRRRERRLEAEARRRAEREIQVREYGGAFYIAYRDTPLVAVPSLGADAAEALAAARRVAAAYSLEQARGAGREG